MSYITLIIGKRLRNFRLQSGMTQEMLAEKAGLHHTYIGQVERGEKNITIESLEKIVMALGISFDQLFEKLGPGSSEEDVAAKCYDIVSCQSSKNQRTLYSILSQIERLME